MNHVLAVREKNTKNVVGNYDKTNIKIKIKIPKKSGNNFFDCKISKILFCLTLKEPISAVFEIKPLFLPIFRNLFFLSLKISSLDID